MFNAKQAKEVRGNEIFEKELRDHIREIESEIKRKAPFTNEYTYYKNIHYNELVDAIKKKLQLHGYRCKPCYSRSDKYTHMEISW